MVVLRDVPVVEIGDAEIEQDVEQEGEVKEGKIKSVFGGSYSILNYAVNPENPERFDQDIQKEQEGQVGDKFLLHALQGWQI